MNDNEIIKALECCAADPAKCKQCPLDSMGTSECFHFFIQKYSLDLINRQKAEIERLKQHNTEMARKHYGDGIKEFAERLKKNARKFTEYDEGGWGCTVYAVKVEDIDNTVEEMTEETP